MAIERDDQFAFFKRVVIHRQGNRMSLVVEGYGVVRHT